MEYGATVITNAGTALMSKLLSGNKLTKFTKIVLSETKYSENQLANLTALSNIKATADATTAARNATNVETYATFNNEGNTASYTVNTIGVMAQDPDGGADILYSVTPAIIGGYVPTDNGVTKTALTFKVLNEVARALVVNMTTDPAGVATYLDLERMKKPYQAWANSADGKTDFSKVSSKNMLTGARSSSVTYANGYLSAKLGDYTVVARGVLPAGVYTQAFKLYKQPTTDTTIVINFDGVAYNSLNIAKLNTKTINTLDEKSFTLTKETVYEAVIFGNKESSQFDFSISVYEGSKGTILPVKRDDRYNAFMKYTGFSNKDSNDYRDYTWVRSDEAQSINYEAWANDKAGKDFSTIYPRENLVRGNVDGFKYWTFFKDSSATNSTGTKEGRTLTVTSTDTAWKQWRMTGAQGSTELSDLGAGTYILSLDARALDDSAVNTKVDIDFRLNKKDGSYVRISSNRVGITKTALRILTTIIIRNEDLIDVVDKTIVLNYQELGKVEFSKIKLEKGDTQSMYIPSSKDTGVKANELVPMYRGIANAPSNDPLDYTWDKSEQYRDAELQQIKTAIIALGGTV